MLENLTIENASEHQFSSTPPNNVPTTVHANRAEQLMSEETYLSARYVIDNFVYVLEVLALICNVLNVLVMTRPSMRSTATRYLAAMSAIQLVYIILNVFISVFKSGVVTGNAHFDFFIMAYRVYVGIYVLPCLSRVHYVLACLVTTERLLAVMMPLKAKNFSVVRHPVIVIAIAPFVVFAAHIHVALKYEVYEVSAGYYWFRFTVVYLRSSDVMSIVGVVTKVCFVYVELLFLLGANTALIMALARHATMRRSLMESRENDATRRRETQMTVTILVSTLVFVVLNLPAVTSGLVGEFIPDRFGHFSPNRWLYTFVMNLGELCYVLAFSTDFFAYICLSTAYRTTLIHLLRTVWPGKKQITEKSQSEMSKTHVSAISASVWDSAYEKTVRVETVSLFRATTVYRDA